LLFYVNRMCALRMFKHFKHPSAMTMFFYYVLLMLLEIYVLPMWDSHSRSFIDML